MASPQPGRWLLVRSDRYANPIDMADTPYQLGRSRSLPEAQLLNSNYVSREQLSVVLRPPHLYVTQIGKNPTFYGTDCAIVPGGASAAPGAPALQFRADPAIQRPTRSAGPDGGVVITVPYMEFAQAHEIPARPTVTEPETTLYFPEETGLPTITVRYAANQTLSRADTSAATTTLSVAQMLAVPTAAAMSQKDSDTDDDGNSGTTGGEATGRSSSSAGPAAQWQGLLDVAMQQQQGRQDAAQGNGAHAALQPPSQKSPEKRPPVQPDLVPAARIDTAAPHPQATGGVAATAVAPPPAVIPSLTAASPTSTTTAAAAPLPQMGFWEWKCRANGKDADPRSWRKYPLAAASVLETAYRAKRTHVDIPDSAMGTGGGGDGCTYGVCFGEKSLRGAMMQYLCSDKRKFRLVRRSGGADVDREGVKRIRVIPEDSSSSEDESEEFSTDDSSEESFVSSSDSDESDDDVPAKKRTRRGH